MDLLLWKTRHVACYRSGTALYSTPGLYCALKVIKAWQRGEVLLLNRPLLVALANRKPRP